MLHQTQRLESQRDTGLDEAYTDRSAIVAAIDTTYERLTSHNCALLLVDHQVGPLWELEFAETRRAVVALARCAGRMRIPGVVTAIAPELWGAVIPELTSELPNAPHLFRDTVNAWDDPAVRRAIERTRRKKLIIAGGAAAVAVAVCALSAADAGYEVYAPVDASAQFSHSAMRRLTRANVIVTTTKLITTELSHKH